MAKNTAEKEDLKLQEVYNTAEQEWASRVINTLLVETQNGEMTIPNGFTMKGISINRTYTGDGWSISFHIQEKK